MLKIIRPFVLFLLLFFSATLVHAQDWLDEVVSWIDPGSVPGQQIATLPIADNRAEIIEVLGSYFRTRPQIEPRWIIPASDSLSALDLRIARETVNHRITTREGTQQFGEHLPWFSPEKRLTTISRFPFFDQLVPAYFHTRDEQFARAMVRDMLDYVAHVPIEKADGFTVQDPLISNPFNWVLLQWRVTRWLDALYYLRNSPSLSNADYLQILLHIWKEVDWMVPRMMLGLHNGTLGNTRTIIYTGLHFRELKKGREWLNFGVSFFGSFLQTAFYKDEFLIELTLGYSEGTLLMATMIYEGLPDNLRSFVREPLERIVEAHIGMMKPDRSLPRYGDHGIYDIRDRLLRTGARLFDREDWLQVAQDAAVMRDGLSFLSFPKTSRPYYLSGYYAMREHWGTQAQYLAMDAGPYGTNHQHSDKLSLVLSADGANFIVDPGTSLYRSLEPGPRYDLRFGFLHNVITIDGIDPNAGWDRHYGFDVLENRWITNPEYDYLEGVYEFRNNLLDIIWRRGVFYRRGEYWILMDALKGHGQHRAESNFQFAPDVEITYPTNKEVGAVAANGAQLHMYALDSVLQPQTVLADTVFPGTTYPIQYPGFVDWTFGGRGWVGYFGNLTPQNPTRNIPAPAVVFSGTVDLPYHSLQALSPSAKHVKRSLELTPLVQTDEHILVKIQHEGQNVTDYFAWFPAPRPDAHVPLADDQGYWVRYEDGQLTEVNFMNIQQIHLALDEGEMELRFSEAAEGFMKRAGDTWTVYLDTYHKTPVSLTSFSPASGRKLLNGNVVLHPGQSKEIHLK